MIAIVAVVLVALLAVGVGFFVRRRMGDSQRKRQLLLGELAALLQIPNLRAREEYEAKFSSVMGTVAACEERLDILRLDGSVIKADTERVLGEGEHGRVVMGHLTLGEGEGEGGSMEVAVKMLHEGKFSGRECVNLLLECRVMAMLPAHPHVIELLGLHIHQAPVMVVTPYYADGDLRNFLRRRDGHGQLDANTLVAFAWQFAQAGAFLHQHMLIHRDLAARNLLVVRRANGAPGAAGFSLKLTDLGLTRRARGDNDYYRVTSDGREPVRWMCPLALSLRRFTRKSDIWAAGVVLWELYSYARTKPYDDLLSTEVHSKVLEGRRLARPAACPEVVYQLMQRCWIANQSVRPSFAELETALAALVCESEKKQWRIWADEDMRMRRLVLSESGDKKNTGSRRGKQRGGEKHGFRPPRARAAWGGQDVDESAGAGASEWWGFADNSNAYGLGDDPMPMQRLTSSVSGDVGAGSLGEEDELGTGFGFGATIEEADVSL